MSENYYTNTKELSFREIVLKLKQKPVEILSEELRLKKKVIPMGNNREDLVVEEEDTRRSFVQSVIAYAAVLSPYFDEKMEEIYGDFDSAIYTNLTDFTIKQREYLDNELQKHYSIWGNEVDNLKIEGEKILPTKKFIKKIIHAYLIQKALLIYKELNKLLKRVDYLRETVYSEEDDDSEELNLDDEENGQ